jgi:hypothetical protein
MTRSQLLALLLSMVVDVLAAFALAALFSLGALQKDPEHTSTWTAAVAFSAIGAVGPKLIRKVGDIQAWLDRLSGEKDEVIGEDERVPAYRLMEPPTRSPGPGPQSPAGPEETATPVP